MVRVPRPAPWLVRALIALGVLGSFSAEALAQKTDRITFDNGDTITCEIKELERGRLRCKTTAMGTVYIKWEHIVDIDTDKSLEVEMESGQRYFGSIRPAEAVEEMTVAVGQATTTIPAEDVAFVRQIQPTFWGKLDGGIDFGAKFTQAENQFDYTLNANSIYTGLHNRFAIDISSSIRVRDEGTTQNRQALNSLWYRALRWQRWFGLAVLSFEHNDELNIDLRSTAGYGVGRFLAQSNRWTWSAYATGLYSRELYAQEEEGNNNLEAGIGTNVQVFTFGDHDTDVNTSAVVLPSLSDWGRVRFQLSAKVKREFVKDFYLSVDLFETYDSRPPKEGAEKNDFGITMSLGWTY